MKAIHAIKLATSALLVVASVGAYAQASDTPAPDSTAANKQQYKASKSANRALQKKVRSALSKAKGVSVANITVRAVDGAVILQGTVPEQAQSDKATEVAKGVAGVTSVKNALSIRPEGT
jgi:hyperosmotically inducible periplasmic protein